AEDVAREAAPLADRLLAALHLDHFLGRHQHLAELVLHARALDAVEERGLDALLLPRVGVDDVPAHRHRHRQPPVPSNFCVTHINPASTIQRKIAMTNTKRNTTPVVCSVSLRVGQTTRFASSHDSREKAANVRPISVNHITPAAAANAPSSAARRMTSGWRSVSQ